MSETSRKRKLAPHFPVPDVPIVSVEHPCVVRNLDKAIRMLGGDVEIANSLHHDNQRPLGLRFQSNDPTSREIVSFNQKTNSILLKVTVPKRTGRKRKRGSNDEFTEDPNTLSTRKDSSYLLQSMEDNSHRYEAEAVGSIHSKHIWRTMPDFVYSSKGSMILNEVTTKVLSQNYTKLKQWSMPRTQALATADSEAIPPPCFSTQSLPYSYVHHPDPFSKISKAKHPPRDIETLVEAQSNETRPEEDSSAPSPSGSAAQVQRSGT